MRLGTVMPRVTPVQCPSSQTTSQPPGKFLCVKESKTCFLFNLSLSHTHTEFGPAIGKEALTNNISNWSCPGVPDHEAPSSMPLTGNPNHPVNQSSWSQVVIWHKAGWSFQVTNTMIRVDVRSKPDQLSLPWNVSQGETVFSWAMRLLGWA